MEIEPDSLTTCTTGPTASCLREIWHTRGYILFSVHFILISSSNVLARLPPVMRSWIGSSHVIQLCLIHIEHRACNTICVPWNFNSIKVPLSEVITNITLLPINPLILLLIASFKLPVSQVVDQSQCHRVNSTMRRPGPHPIETGPTAPTCTN